MILKINHDDPGKSSSVQIWSEVEGASTLEVRRPDMSTVQLINIPELPLFQSTLSDISFLILGFIFWVLGFITWLRRPFLVQARDLFWMNWIIGLAFVLAPASSRDLILARELEYIIFAAVPIFINNFISNFAYENLNRINQLGRLMLTVMSVIILIVTVLQSVGIVQFISPLRKLVLVTVSIGVLFTLWNLCNILKLSKDKPEKNQTNILLLGMAIGFSPFVLLTAIPAVFGFQPIMNAQVSSLFISVIPATWYYAIVNKYLPDSRRIIWSLISYVLAGALMSLIISYLLFVLRIIKTLNFALYLSTLSLIMIFILCFGLIRAAINRFLKNNLFLGEKLALKKRILELNQRLSSIKEEEQILEEVAKSLAIEGVFAIIEHGNGNYFKKSEGLFSQKPSEQVKLVEYYKTDPKIHSEARILSDELPAEIYSLYRTNEFTCGIFLGHRYSHIKFERDELPTITLILSQLAQRLITTLLIKELSEEVKSLTQQLQSYQRKIQSLQRVNSLFFKNFEQEKKALAQDLHDGSLQLALDLNRWLDDIEEECLNDKVNKAPQAIKHMREVISNLNFELRSICSDLRPQTLTDLGLFYAVQTLCEEKMEHESVIISLEMAGFSDRVRLKGDVELVAYRFLQEGITNAIKHSGSSKITLKIELNYSKLELMIRDFGKGLDVTKLEDWQLSSNHFGLVGMKERLEGLGGELQISSAVYQGTILKATIPIREEDMKDGIGQ
ncbi:sensor histidine kinase [Desulfosporosinus acididurans]|uniref:sensor histidine kinase n=1 Tax=Desulfosporosinus acididurans TaxID=476652 RepID=UPI001FA751CF|nr:ATP-binding protein [Desulfosporosinus acididurans]